VSLVFFGLLAWQIVLYTKDLNELGQTTWVVQIPVAPWWALVSLFLILCVAVQLGIFLMQAFGDREGRVATGESTASRDIPPPDGIV
jgi:hypothetical protein